MMLQPRKFKFKNRHKKRTVLSWRHNETCYGDIGLRVLRPYRVSAKKIFRLKVFLKKAVKKSEITKRRVWFNLFPHIPLTKKPKGVRMGKGSGKLNTWVIYLRGGCLIVEFKNLRPGRAEYFLKKVKTKITVPSTTVRRYTRLASFTNMRGVTLRCDKFVY